MRGRERNGETETERQRERETHTQRRKEKDPVSAPSTLRSVVDLDSQGLFTLHTLKVER